VVVSVVVVVTLVVVIRVVVVVVVVVAVVFVVTVGRTVSTATYPVTMFVLFLSYDVVFVLSLCISCTHTFALFFIRSFVAVRQ
jgi:hypothetical protein